MNKYQVRPERRTNAAGRMVQVFRVVQIDARTGAEQPLALPAYAGPVSANLAAAALNEVRSAEVEVS